MKIFISVGTQKFAFDRLLKYIDDIFSDKSSDIEIFAQTGFCEYTPINYKYQQFMGVEDYLHKIKDCNLFITHGGVGSIINGLKYNKKIIAVPRMEKYNEHIDNHQEEICIKFSEKGYIMCARDINMLKMYIDEIFNVEFKKIKIDDNREIISKVVNIIEGLK